MRSALINLPPLEMLSQLAEGLKAKIAGHRANLQRSNGGRCRLTRHGRAFVRSVVVAFALGAVSLGSVGRGQTLPDLFRPAKKQVIKAQKPMLDEIGRQAGVASTVVMKTNLKALDAPSVRLALDTNALFVAKKVRVERRGRDDVSWFGELSGVPGNVTLVVRNGNITGSVSSPRGAFTIRPGQNGTHIITRIDPTKLPPEHPPSFKQIEKRSSNLLPVGGRTPDARADGGATIEVLVAYTAAVHRLRPDADAMAQLAVDEANGAHQNSGVGARLHLAHAVETAYVETGDYDTDLRRLVGNNDGFMDDLHTLRSQYAADVVVLIFDNNAYCGKADAIKASADTAFAVVHYSCATGYYSFAHEIGHLMGCRHNDAADSSTSPFAYGHGYQFIGTPPTTSWRTIMAYDCAGGCPRLQYWSNPGVSYGSNAMGTAASNNNARVWNETASMVAGFRTASYQTRIFESGTTFAEESNGTWTMADYDRDGVPDLVFIKTRNAGTNRVEVHVASARSNYQTRIFEAGTTFGQENDGTWLMSDYDRDGVPDLVFIKTANTGTHSVEVHVASARSGYQTRIFESGTTFAEENDGTWLMADYDRDGIPDLVFIKTGNAGTNSVEVHVASGKSGYRTRIFESGTTFAQETNGTWTMADYDRDGIPDLIFIKTSNTGTNTVEVHVASGRSNYQTRIFESGTTFAEENDGAWLTADWDRDRVPDLVFIKTSNAGTNTVEVHVASGIR